MDIRIRLKPFRWLPVLLVLSASGVVCAQVGSLEVRALDSQDKSPLAGATVTLSSDRGFAPGRPLLTDKDGVIRFPVLKAVGGYSVSVTMPGFQPQSWGPVRVEVDSNTVVELELFPELVEQVTVLSREALVQLDRTGNQTQFSDEFIEQLPIGRRFYQNILTLAPGVNDADNDGNPNVHGSRDRDFQAQVGMVNNADPLTGKRLSWINLDSIETMEILATGAGAEFGRAQGGFARILQKQGTNEFAGVISMTYRSSSFDGTEVMPTPKQLEPKTEWKQPSVTLSGPIARDHLWFRASHEWVDNEDPINALGTIGVIAREQELHSDQITWQATPRNKLAFAYLEDPLTLEGVGLNSRVLQEATSIVETSGPTYSFSWSRPHSSRILLESTLAYQDGSRSVRPASPDAEQDCFVAGWRWTVLRSARCFDVNRNQISGPFNESSDDERERITARIQGTLFSQQFLGASHRLKVGLAVEDERYTRNLQRGLSAVFERDLTPGTEANATAEITVAVPRTSDASATGTSSALYLEDLLKPTSSTSITLGLRLDHEQIRAPGFGPFDPVSEAMEFDRLAILSSPALAAQTAFTAYPRIDEFQLLIAEAMNVFPTTISLGPGAIQSQFSVRPQRLLDMVIDNTYLSPRFAIAWDPFRNGKTKLALTAGRYYDKIFLGVPLVESEPASTSLTFPASRDPWNPVSPYFTQDPTSIINPTVSSRFVDRDLQAPYQDEATLSIEREIFRETSLKVSWIRRRYRDQFQDVDINHLPGDHGRCVRPAFFGDEVVQPANVTGELVLDENTLELYEDTVDGPGDGRIDDCTGLVVGEILAPAGQSEVPDGRPDLYVQNPGWGDVLLLGNFDRSDYEAFSLELVRRQHRGWQMKGSYTWSMARGSGEDYLQELGNEVAVRDDEYGFLSHDQRHVVNLTATTVTPWNLRFGGRLRWESGLPYSFQNLVYTTYSIPPDYLSLGDRDVDFRIRYPSGERNDRRNPSLWTVDLRLAKTIQLGRVHTELSFEGFNLLNDTGILVSDVLQGNLTGARRTGRRLQVGARIGF